MVPATGTSVPSDGVSLTDSGRMATSTTPLARPRCGSASVRPPSRRSARLTIELDDDTWRVVEESADETPETGPTDAELVLAALSKDAAIPREEIDRALARARPPFRARCLRVSTTTASTTVANS